MTLFLSLDNLGGKSQDAYLYAYLLQPGKTSLIAPSTLSCPGRKDCFRILHSPAFQQLLPVSLHR